MNNPLTYQMVQKLNARDEAGLGEIFHHMYADMRNYAISITFDFHESEDIALNVFSKLWHLNKQFTGPDELVKYIVTMTRNASLNYIKSGRRKARNQEPVEAVSDFAYEEAEESYSQYKEMLHGFVEQLSGQCKVVCKLSMEGYSNQEIAKKINLRLNVVEVHKHRAIKKLRELFKI